MQETLELKEKHSTIEAPPIAVHMLGLTGPFLEKLDEFNSRYQTDIKVIKSGRWEQGSYLKFKELSRRIAQPKLESARTIKAVFSSERYELNGVLARALQLDGQLKEIRKQGIKFFQSEDVEGQLALDTLINNLNQSVLANDDIKVEISQIPWFNRHWDRYAENSPAGTPALPHMDRNGNVERITNSRLNIKSVNLVDDPSKWFINIAVPIKDIVVDITNSRGDTIHSYEYGDLLVTQSISIRDAITLSRRVANGDMSMSYNQYFAGLTYEWPKYQALKHPFVTGNITASIVRRANEYGTGNTCFGTFEERILSLFASGNIIPAIPLLRRWSSYYPKNDINPLNRYYKSVFGKPLQINDNDWHGSTSLCNMQVSDYDDITKDNFIETFCSNCQLISNCDTYREWTEEPIVLSFEDDDEKQVWDHFVMEKWLEYSNINFSRFQDMEDFEEYLSRLYVQAANKVKRRLNRHLTDIFSVDGMGNSFTSDSEFSKIWEGMMDLETYNATIFIKHFRLCEEIYYRYIRNDLELDFSLTSIQIIRVNHIARQRANRTPENEIITFANRL